MSTAAVVGAAGFIGRTLCRKLRNDGHAVLEFSRGAPAVDAAGRLAEGVDQAQTAFWLASRINPLLAEADPSLVLADRRAFTEFVDAIAALRTPPRVVLLSSGGSVYDSSTPGAPPFRETSPTGPTSAYGRAKVVLESIALNRLSRVIVTRISNAYGPGQPVASGQGVIAHWLRAARRREPLLMYGDPGSSRDYVYVDDVAAALVSIHAGVNCGALPKIVNIGSGEPTTLADLAEIILTVVGDKALAVENAAGRSFDTSHNWLDVELARSCLGWRPVVGLSQGVAAAWEAVRTVGDPTA